MLKTDVLIEQKRGVVCEKPAARKQLYSPPRTRISQNVLSHFAANSFRTLKVTSILGGRLAISGVKLTLQSKIPRTHLKAIMMKTFGVRFSGVTRGVICW